MEPTDLQRRILASQRLDAAYQLLVNQEDARVCTDIADEACRVVAGNFFLQVQTQFLTKLGDAIANPKTVLAWLLGALGAPAAFVAVLVPIRESGSLIPQLFIASFVRRQALRKWTFVIGCLLQAVAVFAMALVAIALSGAIAGVALIGALLLFSLARGLCSVASKDVLGKTVPKTRRGRVSGWSESLAGAVTIALGAFLLTGQRDGDLVVYLAMLTIAAGLWLLAAASYALVREYPGETEGGGNALTEAMKRMELLRTDVPFRRFVVARSLLLCSALSAPFFILLAQQKTAGALLVLGLFVIADGLASLVSAPFWGRFADLSSRRVMIWAGTGAGLVGLSLVAIVELIPQFSSRTWLYPLFFFALAIAHAGVRLGRKTYVIDLAGGNKRTDYVAVSNTVIGLVLLLTGVFGALATVLPISWVIGLLSLMGLAGARASCGLDEVGNG